MTREQFLACFKGCVVGEFKPTEGIKFNENVTITIELRSHVKCGGMVESSEGMSYRNEIVEIANGVFELSTFSESVSIRTERFALEDVLKVQQGFDEAAE